MRSIDIFLWVADYRDDKKGLDSQMVTKSDTCIGHLVYAVIEDTEQLKRPAITTHCIGVVSKSSKTEYFCGGCLTFVKVAYASDYQYSGTWKAKKN